MTHASLLCYRRAQVKLEVLQEKRDDQLYVWSLLL